MISRFIFHRIRIFSKVSRRATIKLYRYEERSAQDSKQRLVFLERVLRNSSRRITGCFEQIYQLCKYKSVQFLAELFKSLSFARWDYWSISTWRFRHDNNDYLSFDWTEWSVFHHLFRWSTTYSISIFLLGSCLSSNIDRSQSIELLLFINCRTM